MTETRSILGDAPLRVPIGGRIRAGLKRLTREAQKDPDVVAIYERCLDVGATFEQIENEIKSGTKFTKTALVPENVGYFSIRRTAFINPHLADMIVEKYGEVRPDHPNEKRVYALPVILASDNPIDVLPHRMTTYGEGGRKFWSEFDAQGNRVCMTKAPISVADKKAKRRFEGGGPIMLRQVNDGRCEPNNCAQFQTGECKLSGAFRFYVYGVPGLCLIEVPTNSYYSLSKSLATLKMLAAVRNGRISGTHDNKAILWIHRTREDVSRYIPELGQSVRTKQWLIQFESRDFGVMELLQSAQRTPLLAQPAPTSTATTASVVSEKLVGLAEPTEPIEPTPPPQTGLMNSAIGDADAPAPTTTSAVHLESSPAAKGNDGADDIKTVLRKIGQLVQASGVSIEQYRHYALQRFGKGWSSNLEFIDELYDDLRQQGGPDEVRQFLLGEVIS